MYGELCMWECGDIVGRECRKWDELRFLFVCLKQVAIYKTFFRCQCTKQWRQIKCISFTLPKCVNCSCELRSQNTHSIHSPSLLWLDCLWKKNIEKNGNENSVCLKVLFLQHLSTVQFLPFFMSRVRAKLRGVCGMSWKRCALGNRQHFVFFWHKIFQKVLRTPFCYDTSDIL